MQELRITDTNSANDSKGRAFGLEGNNYLYILISLILSFGAYFVLNFVVGVHVWVAVSLTLPIVIGPTAWVVLLKHNKPDGYAGDLLDSLINREGWSIAPPNHHEHNDRS